MLIRISGLAVPASTQAKITRTTSPPTMHSQVAGLLQPQVWACSKPSTDRPMPSATRAAPRKSIRSGRLVVGILAMTASTNATMATGMLIQKIDRQVHWVRMPPAIGPIAVSPPLTPKKIARARPRSWSGNAATTMASAAGIIRAPEMPWSTRKKMIQASASEPFGVAPHRPDEAAKPTIPMVTIRREPITSASRPPRAKVAASASR